MRLAGLGVHVLPVAEVENLLLLPEVFPALAKAFACGDPAGTLAELTTRVMAMATEQLDQVSARYAIRQLDDRLKKVTVKAKDLTTLDNAYRGELSSIDPTALFTEFRNQLERSIQDADLRTVLKLYDNKGLLAEAARMLGIAGRQELLEKVGRLLGNPSGEQLSAALKGVLPEIAANTS